ncbi:hypothetical protein ON010_g5958 [Phytophthora cinnamomi]|nr:hypothetical protein ON010_g5958 [Phytophthora cinnamomi]
MQPSTTSNDLLDTGNLLTALPAAPSPAPAPAPVSNGGGNGMFNGMSVGLSGGVQSGTPTYTSQNTMGMQSNPMGQQQGMVPYGQNMGNGMMNQQQQYNPGMMQMTPYGMQQQAPISGGGYGQGGNMGLAGPGQMLQIQAPGYDPYAPQQQSGDKFSAFDGL